MPKAFLIYGHDNEARVVVERFVRSLGVNVMPFHQAAPGRNDIDYVLATVLNGIEQADVVIALLTPDEQAAWHDPQTGAYQEKTALGESLAGWQPRPNVLLEIGIAVGMARGKMILVRVGPIRTISDLAGVQMVSLDDMLFGPKLTHAIVERIGESAANHKIRGSRRGPLLQRPRWDYHDELGQLEFSLGATQISGYRKTILDAVKAFLSSYDESDWDGDTFIDFIFDNFDKEPDTGESTNAVFWQCVNYGLIAFDDILDDWDDPVKRLWWVDMKEHVSLTSRAKALFLKLRTLSMQ